MKKLMFLLCIALLLSQQAYAYKYASLHDAKAITEPGKTGLAWLCIYRDEDGNEYEQYIPKGEQCEALIKLD